MRTGSSIRLGCSIAPCRISDTNGTGVGLLADARPLFGGQETPLATRVLRDSAR